MGGHVGGCVELDCIILRGVLYIWSSLYTYLTDVRNTSDVKQYMFIHIKHIMKNESDESPQTEHYMSFVKMDVMAWGVQSKANFTKGFSMIFFTYDLHSCRRRLNI